MIVPSPPPLPHRDPEGRKCSQKFCMFEWPFLKFKSDKGVMRGNIVRFKQRVEKTRDGKVSISMLGIRKGPPITLRTLFFDFPTILTLKSVIGGYDKFMPRC